MRESKTDVLLSWGGGSMLECVARSACVYFFFQAEDGIRDYKVTGVQTCALPISYITWFSVRFCSRLEQALSKTISSRQSVISAAPRATFCTRSYSAAASWLRAARTRYSTSARACTTLGDRPPESVMA